VLVPAACQPRRADATEVIGTALVRHALGAGYRQIALALDRSPWTTRSWLRAARPAAHRSGLYRRGVEHLALVDPTALSLLWLHPHQLPARSDHDLIYPLAALVVAAVTFARQLGLPGSLWELVGIAAGSLLPAPG